MSIEVQDKFTPWTARRIPVILVLVISVQANEHLSVGYLLIVPSHPYLFALPSHHAITPRYQPFTVTAPPTTSFPYHPHTQLLSPNTPPIPSPTAPCSDRGWHKDRRDDVDDLRFSVRRGGQLGRAGGTRRRHGRARRQTDRRLPRLLGRDQILQRLPARLEKIRKKDEDRRQVSASMLFNFTDFINLTEVKFVTVRLFIHFQLQKRLLFCGVHRAPSHIFGRTQNPHA